MVAYRESAELAEDLIAESCFKQKIQRDQLTLHADRGSSMKSNLVAQLFADLGVTKTHSRPHVSNDNPYSESAFKTLGNPSLWEKYRPGFPESFGSIEDARNFCRNFFFWYNNQHRHSGIAMLTPEVVHYNLVEAVLLKKEISFFKMLIKLLQRDLSMDCRRLNCQTVKSGSINPRASKMLLN